MIPTYAHVRGIGRVRITGMMGRDRFTVVDSHDVRRLLHRDRLTFLPPKVTVPDVSRVEENMRAAVDTLF